MHGIDLVYLNFTTKARAGGGWDATRRSSQSHLNHDLRAHSITS